MSDKPKVLIFAPREEPPETIKALEGLGCEIVIGNRDWQLPRTHYEDDVVAQARDCVALMGTSMRHTPISRRVMEASQRLRVVAKYTVGVDDIDTEAATDLGIMVCHAPTESNCFGVAETTVAMMLSLLKKLADRDADVRAGKWRTADNYSYYVGQRASDGFRGQTIGFVGFGRIASRVAQLLTPWRARMIAYDPYVQPSQFLTHGVQAVDYETLLRESDLVSFHVVLTKETRYMFGEEQIKLMKPHAVVVNTVARQGDRREGGRARDRGRPPARHRDRCLRGGAAADGFAAAQARQPRAALAALRLLHRGRRAAPGRRLGHALGRHRAQGRHSGQRLQQGRAAALEAAVRRRLDLQSVKLAQSKGSGPLRRQPGWPCPF